MAPLDLVALAALAVLLLPAITAKSVTISNVVPWRDVHGELMDAHDGNVQQYTRGGLFYRYAMEYGNRTEREPPCADEGPRSTGFRSDHNVSVWSSPDLVEWSLETREALPINSRPLGIYFRPKVVYNAETRRYVLWVNYMHFPAPYGRGYYLTASSASPVGPFAIEDRNVTMSQPSGILCDFDLFVDDDGAAYLAYTVWKPVGPPEQMTHLQVERLTDTYLGSTGQASPVVVPPPGRSHPGGADEAPVMIRRGGWYLLLFGHGCCFCAGGSGVSVLAARTPLGPFLTGEDGPAPPYDVGCAPGPDGRPADIGTCNSTVGAQQSGVFTVHTNGGSKQIWTGDRWQSAPDGLKSHDLVYWDVLEWDDEADPPRLGHLQWHDTVTLDLDV